MSGARRVAAFAITLMLGACSWFGDDDKKSAGGDANLASVPARPQPVLSADQRKALTQGLVSDRENARYSDQQLRIGNVPEAAPPRPAAPRPAPAARDSAPAAAPPAPRAEAPPRPAPRAEPPPADPAPAPSVAAAPTTPVERAPASAPAPAVGTIERESAPPPPAPAPPGAPSLAPSIAAPSAPPPAPAAQAPVAQSPAPSVAAAPPAPLPSDSAPAGPRPRIVAPPPPAADPAPETPPQAEAKKPDESPWWWPFGSSSGSREALWPNRPAPQARPGEPLQMEQRSAPESIEDQTRSDAALRTGARGPAATPENMRTPPGVMPVTGKPLPEPDQPAAPPAAVTVPNTPPPAAATSSAPGTSQVVGIRGPGSDPGPARPAPQPSAAVPPPPPPAMAAPPPVPSASAAVPPPPPPAMAALPPPVAPPPPAPPAAFGAPSVTLLATEIDFPATGTEISAAQRRGLEEAVRLHRQGNGRMKVVGLTPRPARDDRAARAETMLAGFGAALERANAVARELVRLGVAESAIDVATAPPGGGRDGRRVEVYVEY